MNMSKHVFLHICISLYISKMPVHSIHNFLTIPTTSGRIPQMDGMLPTRDSNNGDTCCPVDIYMLRLCSPSGANSGELMSVLSMRASRNRIEIIAAENILHHVYLFVEITLLILTTSIKLFILVSLVLLLLK